ncbi:unnamed protein product, partial [Ceratitis capitata]
KQRQYEQIHCLTALVSCRVHAASDMNAPSSNAGWHQLHCIFNNNPVAGTFTAAPSRIWHLHLRSSIACAPMKICRNV